MSLLSTCSAYSSWTLGAVGVSVFLLAWLVAQWLQQSHVPGPFLASISNLPRLVWVKSGNAHWKHIALHEKYGDLVRIGPNTISIGDPRHLSSIYGIGANFKKSNFYRVLQPMSKGRIIPGLFHTQDEKLHRSMKRPIASTYSMTNLVEFEPYVDTTIAFLLKRLEELQESSGRACDLGVWLQWFAFDVMGEITFSKRLGFLDEAKDIEGIMGSIWKTFQYASLVGQMPWLDRLWVKNSYLSRLLPEKNNPVVAFALARAHERGNIHDEKTGAQAYNAKDFMSRFLEARVKDPSIPEWYVTAWATSNMLAGSDTTAILLRSLIYFLLQHPASLQKLQAELSRARDEGRLSDIVTWKESRGLPYLDACVKEAGRLHPPVGLLLEREVPAGGATLGGQHFAEGTVVGMNAWVVHRHKDVFGPDAGRWNPDRWLGDEERRARMERSLLTFGAGHRTCIGKNISYLEIYKLIPTLFARYDMAFADPQKEWSVTNRWMVIQQGLEVYLHRKAKG
ncbi:cytochrome P450 [Xylariomycetidae sp. FL0641]|nr:cytochrome P450 [Xylariomycetidae sp. FL0641]